MIAALQPSTFPLPRVLEPQLGFGVYPFHIFLGTLTTIIDSGINPYYGPILFSPVVGVEIGM